MRGASSSLLVAVLGACAPDIAPGAYLCGPERLCPEGLACNGPDGVCVTESRAQPFACGAENAEVPGDDAPATAQDFGEMSCLSLVRERRGCLPDGDVGDFYTITISGSCTSAQLKATIVYPIAFQRLVMQLGKAGETPMTIDSECPPRGDTSGDIASCLDATVAPGEYVLGVIPDGTGDCDGTCKHNRYGLAVQVTTP